jgi:6-phosphogluconolactonase (cycloisomerase 2 family)
LYALNQRSDSITIFRIDAKTGLLHFTDNYVPADNSTVMLFQH